jgi:hypothetical protein
LSAAAACGEVRSLFESIKAGTNKSFEAWAQLATKLVSCSVAAGGQVITARHARGGGVRNLSPGWTLEAEPLRLRNGKWLRLSQVLVLDETPNGMRMKVAEASYQYMLTEDGRLAGTPEAESWVFRYDYLRTREDDHPPGHLHVSGLPSCPEALEGATYDTLARIHFPTDRISLEAVIRLLVTQFGVTPAVDAWDEILMESERCFAEIAHRSGSRSTPTPP